MKHLLSAIKPEGFGVREKVHSPDRSRCWIAHQGDWRETHSEREMKSLTSSIEEYGSMSFEDGCSDVDGVLVFLLLLLGVLSLFCRATW